jgi:hypothetical protein
MNKSGVFRSMEDTTCTVLYCVTEGCDEKIDLFISDSHISRCPNCGRGYFTEFIVWEVEPNEKVEGIPDQDEWDKMMEESDKRFKEREQERLNKWMKRFEKDTKK